MNRFTDLLQETSDRLELPQPAKSRILLEMAADLEDLYAAYRDQGLGEAEAEARAREHFAASDDAIAELVAIHRTPFQRWMDSLSLQARTLWERLTFIAILLFVLFFAGREMLGTEFFRNASAYVWPVLGVSLTALLLSIAQVYRIYVKKDHRIPTLRRGLPSLLLLGCGALFIGTYGFFIEFYIWMNRITADGVPIPVSFANWLTAGSATMVVGLLTFIITVLIWYVLVSRVRGIEEAELSVRLRPPLPGPGPGPYDTTPGRPHHGPSGSSEMER